MRKRAGFLLIAGGLALAGLTAVLVMGIARQAAAAGRAQVRQVAVVVATRDILDHTQLTADALAVKAFPADFAPPGAFSTVGDLVGKYAQGFIPKDQVVVAGQVQLAPPAPNLSDRITPGLVVMWLPMPDVLANDNALKPGDHVDVLLTAPIKPGPADSDKQASGLSTQTTLQNVEIYRVGDQELHLSPSTRPGDTGGQGSGNNGGGSSSTPPPAASQSGRKAIGVLVDHQDAVVMKFVKDAGGTIDLVTRSGEDQQVVRTEGVTLDSLTDRFRFRIPQPVPATNAVNQAR
jgi:pilus assembly protein CpaB